MEHGSSSREGRALLYRWPVCLPFFAETRPPTHSPPVTALLGRLNPSPPTPATPPRPLLPAPLASPP